MISDLTAIEAPESGGRGDCSCGYVVTSIDDDLVAWQDLGAFFAAVEGAGANTIWVTDHLVSGHPSAEPFVLAAVAATATTDALIGTAVVQLPLRRSAVVAKAATTLQLISGGRFRLGVGVGQHRKEFEWAGADFVRRGAVADQMLRDMTVQRQPSEDWFSIRPMVDVPIWVGGTSSAALRRVAEFGSGWISLFQTPERFAASLTRLGEALEMQGREPASVDRRIILMMCPTDASWSRADALASAARQFPEGTRGIDRFVTTGSLPQCVETIREFEAVGASGIDLQICHPDPVSKFAEIRAALGSG